MLHIVAKSEVPGVISVQFFNGVVRAITIATVEETEQITVAAWSVVEDNWFVFRQLFKNCHLLSFVKQSLCAFDLEYQRTDFFAFLIENSGLIWVLFKVRVKVELRSYSLGLVLFSRMNLSALKKVSPLKPLSFSIVVVPGS